MTSVDFPAVAPVETKEGDPQVALLSRAESPLNS